MGPLRNHSRLASYPCASTPRRPPPPGLATLLRSSNGSAPPGTGGLSSVSGSRSARCQPPCLHARGREGWHKVLRTSGDPLRGAPTGLQGPRRRARHPAPPECPRTRDRAPPRPGSPGPAGAGAALSAAGLAQPSVSTLRIPGAASALRLPRPEAPGCAAGRPLCDQRGPEVSQLGPGRGAQSLPKSERTPPGEGAAGHAGTQGGVGARGRGAGPGRTYLGGRRRLRAGRRAAAAGAARARAAARGRAGGGRLQPADPWQPGRSRGPALAAGAKVPRAPPSPHLGAAGAARSCSTAGRGAEETRRGAEGGEREGRRGEGRSERGRRAGGRRRARGRRGRRAPQPAVTRRFLARPPLPFPARSEAETPRGGGREAPRAGPGEAHRRPLCARPAPARSTLLEERRPPERAAPCRQSRRRPGSQPSAPGRKGPPYPLCAPRGRTGRAQEWVGR